MRAYTFYNPIPKHGDFSSLIETWKRSFEAFGWRTEVLNEDNAKDHPSYDDFCAKVDSLPTTNNRAYEHACYVRWLAMGTIPDGLALMSDFDVVNRSFTPGDADMLIGNRGILILEPTRVPCAVLGSPEGFDAVSQAIEQYQVSDSDIHNGKPHVSDMEIIRKTNLPVSDVCVEHQCSGKAIRDNPGDGWKTAPMIHFSTGSFMKQGLFGKHPKHWLIRNALANLPSL